MAELIRVDRNGTKYYEGMIKCDRPDFKTIVFWDTFKLDRRGYQRRF